MMQRTKRKKSKDVVASCRRSFFHVGGVGWGVGGGFTKRQADRLWLGTQPQWTDDDEIIVVMFMWPYGCGLGHGHSE